MPIHIFPHASFINSSFKNKLFDELAAKLTTYWSSADHFVGLVGNVVIQGKFIDAILISYNTICIFHFLDNGGRIEARKTGNWRANSRPIVGTNAYDLLDTNIKLFYNSIHKIKPVGEIQGLALFSKPITYIKQACPITDSWFNVSDVSGLSKSSGYIGKSNTKLNQSEINEMLLQLGVSADILPKVINPVFVPPASLEEENQSKSEEIKKLFASAKNAFRSRAYSLVIKNLTQLEELTFNHAGMYFLRGVAYYELSLPKEALADLNTTLRIDSGQADAYFYRAMVRQEPKYKKETLADFDKAIVLDPHKEEYYQKYGEYLYGSENFKAAIANFNEHINLKSDAAIAYYYRGCSYQRLQKSAEAIADYEMALRLEPEMTLAEDALKKLKKPSKVEIGNRYFEEGILKQQSGDLDGAIKCFTLAILADPSLAEAHHKRAKIYATTNKKKEALIDFGVAINLSPNPSLYFDRGQLLLSLESYEAACNDFTEVLKHYTAYPEAFYSRGKCYYELNCLQEAVQDFETVTKLDLNNHLAPFYLGLIKLNNFKNYQESETHFTDALDNKIDFTEAYYHRGLSRFKRAKFKIAAQDFDAAISLGFTEEEIILKRAEARVEIGNHNGAIQDYTSFLKTGTKTRTILFSRGRSKQITADYQGAIDDFTAALNSKVDDLKIDSGNIYYYIAQAYKAVNKIVDAIESFSHAISYGMSNSDVFYFRGSCYNEIDKLKEAEADLLKATQLTPTNSYALNELLTVREKIANKNAPKSISNSNSITNRKEINVKDKLKTPIERAKQCVDEGLKSQQNRFYSEAIIQYNQAIEHDPKNSEAYYQRGTCLYALESIDKALADFMKALSINPNYSKPKEFVKQINKVKARSYFIKGVDFAKAHKHVEAIASYDSAIALVPDNKIYFNYRGVSKGEIGHLHGAISDYNAAISVDPNYSQAYNNRGAAWQKLRELARAVDDFSKAVQIDPSYSVAYDNLKIAMFLLGSQMQ